nr:MAG TPA: hypothetical protein [Bacteriophage sp.]
MIQFIINKDVMRLFFHAVVVSVVSYLTSK